MREVRSFDGLVVKEKLFGIEDRPQDILVALPLCSDCFHRLPVGRVARLVDVRFGEREFGGFRLAGVCDEVKLAELVFIRTYICCELRRGSIA